METAYVFDPQGKVLEETSEGTTISYVYLKSRHLTRIEGEETLFYGTDHLGSTVLLTDETGRFISEDPIRDGMHWYVYVSNNPMGNIDPSGLREIVANDEDGNPILTNPDGSLPDDYVESSAEDQEVETEDENDPDISLESLENDNINFCFTEERREWLKRQNEKDLK